METEKLKIEIGALLVLFFGALLRFYRLSDFAFHPDEAIHAWFSLRLPDYRYDPVYHGPLLYHIVALAFKIFGATDFCARAVPAALGVLLLWMVLWPGRRFLTTGGALWSGFLVALSPVIVTYSRRLLHDSLVLVLTLGAVLCFARALEESSTSSAGRSARLGLAAILALFLATKANVFFIAAMLLAFWVAWKIFMRARGADEKTSTRFDWQTPVLCAGVALMILLFLFGRGVLWAHVLSLRVQGSQQARELFQICATDAKSALPRMIEYWSGQQKHPRLPGPRNYYFVLMALYELPIVLSALWGAWRALQNRAPFLVLLLWWTSTSLALYALANEKVPWLLAHQILPLCLLGGYGISQLKSEKIWQKSALGAGACACAIFLGRHVEAVNFERAADRHEPLLFAQTTETYRDDLLQALQSTASDRQLGVWVEGGEQWPAAWYLRDNSPVLNGSLVSWDLTPPAESTLRVVLCAPNTWKNLQFSGRFASWKSVEITHYIWPRAGAQSLAPQRFAGFWLRRDMDGVLAEDSTASSVIAWKSR